MHERRTLEAIASSLTELFAAAAHAERIAGMLEHHDFITDGLVAYFLEVRCRASSQRQSLIS